MNEKKKRRKVSKWRKGMLVNGGIPNSGTQSAVTQGDDLEEAASETDKENEVANSYDGGGIFKDKAIWTP